MSTPRLPLSSLLLLRNNHPITPPWEVLLLVSQQLDPKTLAIASCVCKSWSISLAHDHLWEPLCLSHFPTLSSLRLAEPTVSYRRLFALGNLASKNRKPDPIEPRISLDDLIFIVDVFCNDDQRMLSIAKSGAELDDSPSGVFRFDVKASDEDCAVRMEEGDGVRVAWTVVSKGCKAAFFVMDGKGNGKLVGGNERWFSEELPSPRCCSSTLTSGLVAEVGLGFSGDGDGKEREKVSLGLMSVDNPLFM